MQEIILSAHQISKYARVSGTPLTILQDISFALPAASSLAITGVSGAGKSTLLGLLAGLDLPDEGRIELAGENLTALDEDGRARLRKDRVGFVFQSFQLLPGLTALENVMLPLELAADRQVRTAARRRAGDLLQRVGLGERLHHYPRQLSGGEQQRVAIARAFATRPAILFADEPTGNLDAATAAQIANLLFALNQEHGTTLVLVTHDVDLANRCRHRLQLAGGRIHHTSLPEHGQATKGQINADQINSGQVDDAAC